jgi:hypothetical protein
VKRALGFVAALAACTPEYAPLGEHRQYVVSNVRMPSSPSLSDQFAVLLGTQRANKIGASFAGRVPLQLTMQDAITTGRSSLLLDVQALDLESTAAAGISLRYGDQPVPAPCNGPPPFGCGQHLNGDARFDLIRFEPPERFMTATIRDGVLQSETAPFAIELSFDGMSTITVPFVVGSFELTDITDNAILRGVMGGAIPVGFIQGILINHINSSFNQLLSKDCVMAPPTGCECNPGPASMVAQAFDTNIRDCSISQVELETNPAISQILAADLQVEQEPSVSFGIEITATSATFATGEP